MASRWSGGVLLAAVAAWALAGGCVHGLGASRFGEPSVEAARACARIEATSAPPASNLAGRPLAETGLALGQQLYCLGLYGASLAALTGQATAKPDAGVDANASLNDTLDDDEGAPAPTLPLPALRTEALRWLVYIHRRFPAWEGITNLVGEAPRADLELPELADLRDDLHALAGRFEYGRGRLDEAVALLRMIPAGSPLHVQAALLEGAVHVRASAPQPALAAFEEALRAAPADGFPASVSKPALAAFEAQRTAATGRVQRHGDQDLAILSIARVYYAMGQFDAASRGYDLLPPPSPYWPAAALEGAWASFKMKDHRRALARVRALEARSSEVPIEVMAEAAMLKATIALEKHRLTDANRIVEAFNAVYPDLFTETKRLSLQEPELLYDIAFSVRAGGALPAPLEAGPMRLLLADVPLARRFEEIDELGRELARYDTLGADWRSSPDGKYARSELGGRRFVAAREAGELFKLRLQRLVESLVVQIKQSVRIEYQSMPVFVPWEQTTDEPEPTE